MIDNQHGTSRTEWRARDIIRHRQTGKPYLVLHVYIDLATLVFDLESKTSPILPMALLPKDYADYACEKDMVYNERTNRFLYQPIQI